MRTIKLGYFLLLERLERTAEASDTVLQAIDLKHIAPVVVMQVLSGIKTQKII